MRQRLVALPGYLGLSLLLTWPAVLELGRGVPGSERTDLWNSLWSFWFAAEALWDGRLPYQTELLNHPKGGTLFISDPLGVLFTAPLIPVLGLPLAYTLLVLWRLSFAGYMAHLFAGELLERLFPERPQVRLGAWIAGVGVASAPVLLSAIHNGTSEAFNMGWAVAAVWLCWRAAVHGGWKRTVLAGLALFLACAGSWYAGLVAFVFAGAIVAFGAGAGMPWRRHLGPRLGAILIGVALTIPLALAFQAGSTGETNLVGIKNKNELMGVRRTTGPADPLGYVVGGDFRSPDFRVISRYGENFFHCHYLGWTLIIGTGIALWRRRAGTGFLWLGGVLSLVLSMGPVLVSQGTPLIVLGDRAIPLPYFLVERLPGFSSLSILYRLALGPALAVALLAATGVASLGRAGLVPIVAVLVLIEGRMLSPLGRLPEVVDAEPAPAIVALAEAPPGAVMNFPVVGGRAYLYEQTIHQKPIAGTLNFPNNMAGDRVWRTMLDEASRAPNIFRAEVARAAKARGIRYLVVHVDPMARPDMHDEAVRVVKDAMDPMPVPGVEDPETLPIRVYRLW